MALCTAAAHAEPTFYQARVAPIFDRHCVVCHGAEKQKAGLRLDSFDHLLKGAESGAVLKAGDAKGSELLRRVKLPSDDDEAMPSDGKPRLSPDEVKILELWIAGGASPKKELGEFPGAPVPRPPQVAPAPLAPDWRPHAKEIAALERSLGVRLVPRSQIPTDGLILRTASAPSRCDDATLVKLQPIAALLVDAELARTKVTDRGLQALAAWENLRALDLTRTAITAGGAGTLVRLAKLEALNLTDTATDEATATQLKSSPNLKRLWLFGTPAMDPASRPTLVTK